MQTLEELDSHPDFQLLLLDKNTAIQQLAQSSTRNPGHNSTNINNSTLKKKIKKKEKMKIRKELLEKKIHVIKLLKQEEKGISYLFDLLYSYFNERERCNC